jgi:predicted ATPase
MDATPPQPAHSPVVPSESALGHHGPAGTLWHVDLLGGLRLSDGTQDWLRLPSRAITALLARLALAPERAHAREELIELLWPGVALDVGRNRLRQALSTLKSILEPASRGPGQAVLQADRTHVRVVGGALACDARQFEQHVRAGRVEAARNLYRGELLPGFYDDWIDDERVRLIALHERLPLAREAAVEAPAAAGAPPPTEARVPAGRVTLPHYLTRMFGADEQGAQLRGLVLSQRLVTLIGPGGAGKTRLAVEVAHSLREPTAWPLPASPSFEPFDLIAFIPLAASASLAQALDAMTTALQIASGADAPQAALAAALSGRRALLVLDNFEQLVGQAEQAVAQLLAELPALHLLVTSRRALGLAGEHEFAVETLRLPGVDADLADAAANPAVALFVARACAVRSDFHLGPRNADTIARLVRALEGMPLAIELAASRVRSIAPADMLRRLRSAGTPHLDLLQRSGARGAADLRHASMQRTIAWSLEQLDADRARLLTALTVFAAGFTAAAARALTSEEAFDTALLLDDLVANSLVHRHTDGEGDRFGLYQPIREFAAASQDAASARHWRRRLRAWALGWALALPRTPPLATLRIEMPNLLAALAYAVDDGEPADAIELLLALRRCLEDVELPAEGLAHAQAAVERCADPVLKARGSSLLGPLLFTAGQVDAALHHAERGAACPLLDGDQRARALHALARVRWRSRRRAEEVEPLLDEADALAAQGADIELRASLLALRAFVANAHHRDRVAGARLHAQALVLWQQLGNRHAINSGRYNLAVCVQNANRHHEALAQLEPIIASAFEEQDWRRLNQSLNVRGDAHSGLRQWALAVADYRQCIRTAWKGMASFDLAYGLWNLPRALAHLRQPEAAVRLMAYAAAFWRERFGELSPADHRDLRRLRRLAARQLAAARIDALAREGEGLSLSQAVALALAAEPAG